MTSPIEPSSEITPIEFEEPATIIEIDSDSDD
jgi:hypothetical protein